MTPGADRVVIRPAERSDHPGIVALNAAAVVHTSAMDIDLLAALAGLACYLKVAIAGDKLAAFLFAYARGNGIHSVTCEYNVEPPNPASAAFHQSAGFREIGTQWVANRSKRVSLQEAQP